MPRNVFLWKMKNRHCKSNITSIITVLIHLYFEFPHPLAIFSVLARIENPVPTSAEKCSVRERNRVSVRDNSVNRSAKPASSRLAKDHSGF